MRLYLQFHRNIFHCPIDCARASLGAASTPVFDNLGRCLATLQPGEAASKCGQAATCADGLQLGRRIQNVYLLRW